MQREPCLLGETPDARGGHVEGGCAGALHERFLLSECCVRRGVGLGGLFFFVGCSGDGWLSDGVAVRLCSGDAIGGRSSGGASRGLGGWVWLRRRVWELGVGWCDGSGVVRTRCEGVLFRVHSRWRETIPNGGDLPSSWVPLWEYITSGILCRYFGNGLVST